MGIVIRFNKLKNNGNNYFIISKKFFEASLLFDIDTVIKVYDFAYSMTFDSKGHHRSHRSGGSHHRKYGEIFINTFQGKLAEFGLYYILAQNNLDIKEPDITTFPKGVWDSYDLSIRNFKINIKSTKSFGNLLLLESKDWDSNGNYIPNNNTSNEKYDFFILTRLDPDGEKFIKGLRLYYSDYNNYGKELLKEKILQIKWKMDCPGYATYFDISEIIKNNYFFPRNSFLNGKTKMDADNYYIQAGDLRSIDTLIDIFRECPGRDSNSHEPKFNRF